MSVGAPSRQAILSLYHSMLRTSQSFSSYNFREYFVRRTKNIFHTMQNESNQERLRSMYSDAVKESTVLKRSAAVNQIYGGWKLAVEAKQLEAQPETIKTRGDI